MVASDGLFDNVHLSQIEDIVNCYCRPLVEPERATSKIPLISPKDLSSLIVDVSFCCYSYIRLVILVLI